MTTITFDTHKFVRRLVAEGATEGQAQAHVDALQEAFSSHAQASSKEITTKADVAAARANLKEEIALFKADIMEWELRLTLRLGSIMMLGLIATAVIANFL